MADLDYAVPIAERIVGAWKAAGGNGGGDLDQNVHDLVAAGVRAGYALGLGVNS